MHSFFHLFYMSLLVNTSNTELRESALHLPGVLGLCHLERPVVKEGVGINLVGLRIREDFLEVEVLGWGPEG